MISIKSCEEIVYNFKKDSFSAVVWAIGSLKGVKEIIAVKSSGLFQKSQWGYMKEHQ